MTADHPHPIDPNSWLPLPLRKLVGNALQGALNHTLSLDPDTERKLAALDGRSVQLHLRGPELALAITVEDARLKIGPPQQDEQLRVAATPGSLLAMLFARSAEGVPPGKVEIAGDAELARRLQQLASTFAPDIEEAFARTFGDVIGVPMARAFNAALSHAKETASHLTQDSADWLRDEARIAVAPGEADDFLDGVDEVRERTERLQARLDRLQSSSRGNNA